MNGEIFSSTGGDRACGGRVVEIGRGEVAVAVRSTPLHCGCHWVGQHVICGGSKCKLCAGGMPKRPFSFLGVQRTDGSAGIVRCTPRDVAAMEAAARANGDELSPGAVYGLSRPVSRQPLAVRWHSRARSPWVYSAERLALEVLRVHQVQATERDLEAGRWVELVIARADEISRLTGVRS